jgi:hypothetical protein
VAKKRNNVESSGSAGATAAAGAARARIVRPAEAKSPKTPETRKTAAADTSVFTSEGDEIARLAYFYWQERGRPSGTGEEDWFRAEQEVRSRRKAS